MPPIFSRLSVSVLLASAWIASTAAAETAADVATRALLDAIEERQMPDVSLLVIARVEADPDASADIKREAAFRRAAALIGVSRTEADGGKKAAMLDEAQASLDAFLASGTPTDRQAIAAYTQRSNLLVERGRAKADQANRPGADAAVLRAEAVKFFDEALKSIEGKVKPGQPVTEVTNAEDAVIKVLREIDGRLAALVPKEEEKKEDKQDTIQANDAADANTGADGKGKPDAFNPDRGRPDRAKPPRAPRLSAKQRRELESLEEEQKALRGKLILTQLAAAAVMYEKAMAYPEKSKERADTLATSAEMFKEIADKHPLKGGGLFARYYEGRNYALLGKRQLAVDTLSDLASLEDRRAPLQNQLRSKALATTLECLLAEKKYEDFDESARKFALEDVTRLPGGKLDADWLALKYRAAVILDARADALDPKDATAKMDQSRLQADARKLAVEVATADAEFAAEARVLAAKLGRVVAAGERAFSDVVAEAKDSLTTMQAKAAEAKAAAAAQDAATAEAARREAASARDATITTLEEALTIAGIAAPLSADFAGDDKLTGGVTIDDVNQARYQLTFLLYDAGRHPEAAALGRMLAERYPNAKGSRQAAKIAMAAWQLVGQQAAGAAKDEALARAAELAGLVMRTWPAADESSDAAVIAIAAAVAAGDPDAIVSIIGQVPAESPRRGEVFLRAGVALWQKVQERRRREGEAADAATLQAWMTAATKTIDDGLAGLGDAQGLPPPPLGSLAVAAALSRAQIAMEAGDDARAAALLQHPVYGPWTLVSGDSPVLKQGPLAEAALTLALRLFIQTEDFEKAQQAMTGLESVAGQGAEASKKLTAMYLSMGRDLQAQLEILGSEDRTITPEVRQRAEKILGGFERFLDGVAARDKKASSQLWVATTYVTLGSGKGTGAVVPAARKAAYLKKAADVFQKLLAAEDDPDTARFVPSIRLRLATISNELGDSSQALEHIEWILSDATRQNSLEAQIAAAEILQATGRAAAEAGDADKANDFLREAAGGRKEPPVVIWGWGTIANRLARQGLGGTDEKAQLNRDAFFEARLRVVECLLARARLPGKEKDRPKRLETADVAIAMTRKTYPDMGGEAFERRFERVLKDVQREQGKEPVGFAAIDKPVAAGTAVDPATGGRP